MATVQTARPHGDYDRTVMPGVGFGQSLKAVVGTYTFSAAVPIGTVIEGPLIQKGSTIVDVMVVANGGGSATFNVGYGGDVDYFAAAGAGPVVRSSAATAVPLKLLTNDTVDVVTAGAVTGAAGSITIIAYVLTLNG